MASGGSARRVSSSWRRTLRAKAAAPSAYLEVRLPLLLTPFLCLFSSHMCLVERSFLVSLTGRQKNKLELFGHAEIACRWGVGGGVKRKVISRTEFGDFAGLWKTLLLILVLHLCVCLCSSHTQGSAHMSARAHNLNPHMDVCAASFWPRCLYLRQRKSHSVKRRKSTASKTFMAAALHR